MAAVRNPNEELMFYVVHPLYDEPEEKINLDSLGPMPRTKSVKYSLLALRVYLVFMLVLAFYRALDMAGIFGGVVH